MKFMTSWSLDTERVKGRNPLGELVRN